MVEGVENVGVKEGEIFVSVLHIVTFVMYLATVMDVNGRALTMLHLDQHLDLQSDSHLDLHLDLLLDLHQDQHQDQLQGQLLDPLQDQQR